jgi:hypothetical protein
LHRDGQLKKWEGHLTEPFQVYGPYDVDREDVHEKKWQKEAWDRVNGKEGADLASAKGVYVFSLRHGKRYTPLYVGMTNRGFRHEVFGLHNLNKIATKWKKEKGAIEVHLLAKPKGVHLLAKPKGVHRGFSKNISKDLLEALEVLLIFMCRRSNKKLINKKNIKWLNDAGIRGITGTEKHKGQPTLSIQTFKRVLKW